MSAIRTASGLKVIARISVRNPANALKEVMAGHLRDAANGLRDIASVGGMVVTAAPSDAFGYGNSHASIVISTTSCTVSIEGGTGPYILSWGADLGQMEAVSPSSYTTIFRSVGGVGPGDSTDDIFICTVTDANSNVALSNPVSATVSNFGT